MLSCFLILCSLLIMAFFHAIFLSLPLLFFSTISTSAAQVHGIQIPSALQKLASPLPSSTSHLLLQHVNEGKPILKAHKLCSAAMLYCPSQAIYPSPRVCIPFFNYEYGIIPCEHFREESSHSQASLIFFKPEALTRQATIVSPNLTITLNGRHFLPQELAEALPLHEGKLKKLQKLLNISRESGMYESMRQTIHSCSSSPVIGEQKKCVSSAESMVKYARDNLGSEAQLLTPAFVLQKEQEAKVLSVVDVNKGEADKRVIACHNMMFPWLVYSCHMTSSVQIMDVVLVGKESGEIYHNLAVCHLDTKAWNPTHISLRVLNMKPGEGEVCHWVPQHTFLWK